MRQVTVILLALACAAGVSAAEFCGGNGVIKLSFTPGPEVSRVAEIEPGVPVEVYAILDDVALAEGPRGVMQTIGAFELELRITGGEVLGVTKTVLAPHIDFGSRQTQVWAGFRTTDVRIDQGPLALVRWTVVLGGEADDVYFDLDPAGLLSCKFHEECMQANASALYIGTVDVAMEGFVFAAGCAPAVLNPTGEPDLAIRPCTLDFTEVGIFKAR